MTQPRSLDLEVKHFGAARRGGGDAAELGVAVILRTRASRIDLASESVELILADGLGRMILNAGLVTWALAKIR